MFTGVIRNEVGDRSMPEKKIGTERLRMHFLLAMSLISSANLQLYLYFVAGPSSTSL